MAMPGLWSDHLVRFVPSENSGRVVALLSEVGLTPAAITNRDESPRDSFRWDRSLTPDEKSLIERAVKLASVRE